MSDPQHHDPRMGDEGEEVPPSTPRHVRIPPEALHPSDSSEKPFKPRGHASSPPRTSIVRRVIQVLPVDLSWIPPNLTWSKIKPVIRCAVVCWVSALLMIIGPTARLMGSVSSIFMRVYALHSPYSPLTRGKLSFRTHPCPYSGRGSLLQRLQLAQYSLASSARFVLPAVEHPFLCYCKVDHNYWILWKMILMSGCQYSACRVYKFSTNKLPLGLSRLVSLS